MRIAVIGGNGQTGNYLLPLLVREGHEVISVCRGNKGYFRKAEEFDSVREVHLARGTEGFEQKIAELGCDVVVDTICFTKNEARAMASALLGTVRHYVIAGSISLHG